MRKDSKVFVFSGRFASIDQACLYSEPQWEPEPDEAVSAQEYAAWEDRNPTHRLKQNINHYLDSDFIETIEDRPERSRHDYLVSLLRDKRDMDAIKALEPSGANIFVLVFQEAFDDYELKEPPVSTAELVFCGQYPYHY